MPDIDCSGLAKTWGNPLHNYPLLSYRINHSILCNLRLPNYIHVDNNLGLFSTIKIWPYPTVQTLLRMAQGFCQLGQGTFPRNIATADPKWL